MWGSPLRIFFHSLRKNKGYSFLNIFGLAIGIASAGLIFLWVDDEFSFDDVNLKKDRIYAVRVTKSFDGKKFTMGSTPRPLAASLEREVPGIVATARISDTKQRVLFTIGSKALYADGLYADPSIFKMLTFNFIDGSASNPFTQLNAIVVTRKTAVNFFGHADNLIGKTVRINTDQDFVITAVVSDPPENSSLQFEWLAPYINKEQDSWGSYGPYTYVELDQKADLAAINKQLENFIEQKQTDQEATAFLFPMSKWRLYNEFDNGKQTGGGRIKQVQMISAIAWIILLIACINFMNLATASSMKRAREVGVRKVLGAARSKLVIQFMGESFFMSVFATLLAVVIILFALPSFNTLMQKQLVFSFDNPSHIAGLISIAVICGLIAGSYPAVYLSSFSPAFVLKGINAKSGSASMIRKGLVVLQFSVSVIFIIGTIIIYQQIQYVKNRNLGFIKENLIELDAQHDISKIFPRLKQELLSTGVIQNMATADHATMNGGNTDDRFLWQHKKPNDDISIAFRYVSPEYITTSGMNIIDGKDFNQDGRSQEQHIIINRAFANLLGDGSAIGKYIQSPRGNEEGKYTNLEVVGVVDDYIYGDMYGRPGPVLFFCQAASKAELLYVRIKPGSGEQALKKIQELMKKYDPAYPLLFRFVDEQFERKFFNEMLVGRISGVFSMLAIIISCLGLFGLAAYTAERRTKEIGIHKLLGASFGRITSLLTGEFVKLVFIACIIASPMAWWIMNTWLEDFQYRIAINPWIFAVACIFALSIALATISIHAVKTAVRNPVDSLRTE
jgi:predicted permease